MLCKELTKQGRYTTIAQVSNDDRANAEGTGYDEIDLDVHVIEGCSRSRMSAAYGNAVFEDRQRGWIPCGDIIKGVGYIIHSNEEDSPLYATLPKEYRM
jgi:hypothetical protein